MSTERFRQKQFSHKEASEGLDDVADENGEAESLDTFHEAIIQALPETVKVTTLEDGTRVFEIETSSSETTPPGDHETD